MQKNLTTAALRRSLHLLFDIIIDSFEELISLIVAGFVLYKLQFQEGQTSFQATLSTILAVLWLVAFSNLRYKYGHKRLSAEFQKLHFEIDRRIVNPIRAENLFSLQSEPTRDFFLEGKEVYVSGITLVKTIGKYHETIAELLGRGSNVRVLLLKTTGDSIKQLRLRSWGPTKPGYYQTRIKTTDNQLNVIAENILTTGLPHGSLSVGYLPFVPSFGVTMVNPKASSGKAWVELYHHKTSDTAPNFYLSASSDKKWFVFFRKQFDEMWKAADKKILLRASAK